MQQPDTPTEAPPAASGNQQDTPPQGNQFNWAIAGPYLEKILGAGIEALERSTKNTGYVTGALLALIIVCMTALSALALYGGHIDTAEKVIIALVSFLGGAAMFSGSPKK